VKIVAIDTVTVNIPSPFQMTGGYVDVTDTPGFGIERDEGLVREYARRYDEEGPCWFWAGPRGAEWEPARIW